MIINGGSVTGFMASGMDSDHLMVEKYLNALLGGFEP
jgi:hypothetical protein